jgi:hypothetical protein
VSEIFLSFDGSQGHTESYSEQSNSMNSNCSSQGQNGYNQNHVNVCSNEDVGDESSESFHICMAGNAFHKKPQVGNRLAKFQTLTALQEQASELSVSSDLIFPVSLNFSPVSMMLQLFVLTLISKVNYDFQHKNY